MFLLRDKYERAKKWQLEQKEKIDSQSSYRNMNDISPEDIVEKGDMLAMMISGMLTIFPIVVILLLIIVVIGMAFMHIL